MKLSEALRKGAALHPQGFGALFRADKQAKVHTCALGAAYGALKGDGDYLVYGMQDYENFADDANNELYGAFEGLSAGHYIIDNDQPRRASGAELKCRMGHDLMSIVVELNDTLEWTREQIADWLETEGY